MGGGIDGIVPAADGVLRHVRALDAAYARFHTKGHAAWGRHAISDFVSQSPARTQGL
jgi:hypothetical protein